MSTATERTRRWRERRTGRETSRVYRVELSDRIAERVIDACLSDRDAEDDKAISDAVAEIVRRWLDQTFP
jgi:acetyl-CoA carboxylase alpha subunit